MGTLDASMVSPREVFKSSILSETIQSLPEDLEHRFQEKFELPEQFFRTKDGIEAVKYDPGIRAKEHDMAR